MGKRRGSPHPTPRAYKHLLKSTGRAAAGARGAGLVRSVPFMLAELVWAFLCLPALGRQGRQHPPARQERCLSSEEWVTGEEPTTGAQDSYLHTLAREAGEQVKEDLTKAEAFEKIEELQEKTGRGTKARKPRARKKSA